MLPDLRIVIAAVVSTFIFTVGVGFFASSRLIHEQMTARIDTKGFDDTPINRIALNWPEPTKSERNIDLDFAVSAKGSRNPVRDIAPDNPELGQQAPKQQEQQEQQAQWPKAEAPAATEASQEAPPAPAVESPTQQPELAIQDARPAIAVAKAPDPVEDTAPAALAAPESTSDTHVIVRPDETTADAESTGSIPAPALETPDIPIPEARPKFAARPEVTEPTEPAKPAVSAPAQAPSTARKRPRPATARQRPVARNTAPQTQQLQPFDFFGLFRAPPATFRLPPQVTVPATTPIN